MARGKPWSRDVWKIIAIMALSMSAIMAAVGVYVVLAFKSNIDVISDGAPVCMAGMRDYDSIAAAQAIGRLDLVSFLLTTGGVLLGVFSLIGFWIIRREAMEEARDAALTETQKFLARFDLEENGKRTYKEGVEKSGKTASDKRHARSHGLDIPKFSDVPTAGAILEQPGETDDDVEGRA